MAYPTQELNEGRNILMYNCNLAIGVELQGKRFKSDTNNPREDIPASIEAFMQHFQPQYIPIDAREIERALKTTIKD